MQVQKKRVAIVGGGISGLSCAYALRNNPHLQITLFEQETRLGGHSNTVEFTPKMQDISFGVDTGFLVFNQRTYPKLIQFFQELDVPIALSEMSFSVSIPQTNKPNLEWAGHDLNSLFAQRKNLFNPHFLRMTIDILRFNALAKKIAATPKEQQTAVIHNESVQEFLTRHHLSNAFRDWYLLPMIGAIWSCSMKDMLSFPIHTLTQFCENHGLLQITNRPQWLTVKGGSREYLLRAQKALQNAQVLIQHQAVKKVYRDAQADGSIRIELDSGESVFTDEIVFACHSDQALDIIQNPTSLEQQMLGAIPYKKNKAYLHEDVQLLPQIRSVWAAWNYASNTNTTQGLENASAVCVHYLINKLQPLPVQLDQVPVIVSLNPHILPKESLTHQVIEYSHPLFNQDSIGAQQQLPVLQGQNQTWFCGAWTCYGFHEDGFKSGQLVANRLSEKLHLLKKDEVLA